MSLLVLISHAVHCKPQTGLASSPDNAHSLGSLCACSKSTLRSETTSARSFLLFFSAGTYVLLKEGRMKMLFREWKQIPLNAKRNIMSQFMEICSVRTRIAGRRGRNAGKNLKVTRPEPMMTMFFQNFQFDMGSNRIPVQDRRKVHRWIQQCMGLSGKGLLPWLASGFKDEASLAGGDS